MMDTSHDDDEFSETVCEYTNILQRSDERRREARRRFEANEYAENDSLMLLFSKLWDELTKAIGDNDGKDAERLICAKLRLHTQVARIARSSYICGRRAASRRGASG